MAAGSTQIDVLSRVRREQRMRGKVSDYSGLRIVFVAAAITVAILIAAFGAVGILIVSRAPQDSIVTRLDPLPEFTRQAETQQIPAATPEQQIAIPEPEIVPPPSQRQLQRQIATLEPLAKEVAVSLDPETTSAIPAPAAQTQRQVPQSQAQPRAQSAQQQHQQQQQPARRQVPESQSDNPLFQLFGIRKYR